MPVTLLNPHLSERTNKLFHTMGHGIQIRRKEMMANRADRRAKKIEQDLLSNQGPGFIVHTYNNYGIGGLSKNGENNNNSGGLVSVNVTSDEVLPAIFLPKQQQQQQQQQQDSSLLLPLKYFMVDSRPDCIAKEQGRFPTAMRLSPETLMDADLYHQQVDKFESLRGAVHICIIVSMYRFVLFYLFAIIKYIYIYMYTYL